MPLLSERAATVAAGYSSLLPATHARSAISQEARLVQERASAVMESGERSIALFGGKSKELRELWAVFDESREEGADESDAISYHALDIASDFIRALPDDVPLPELAGEPGGYVSMDWIMGRSRVFSVSVGPRQRLPYAWLDGADQGHAVAFFDRSSVPPRILDGIRRTVGVGKPPFRAS
ncbi:MAG TPA: hypothetical protein VFC51_13735 [Chloroflexota bacterium]|nr:hypothetical protein [Chloroflexota bacterium]